MNAKGMQEYVEWGRKVVDGSCPVDRVAARRAFGALYAEKGLPEPEMFWVKNPRDGLFVVRLLKGLHNIRLGGIAREWQKRQPAQWQEELFGEVVVRHGKFLCRLIGEKMGMLVEPGGQLEGLLRERVLGVTLEEGSDRDLMAGFSLGNQLGALLAAKRWGVEKMGQKAPRGFVGLCAVAEAVGWFWTLDAGVVAVEKAQAFRVNREGRLNCRDGAAVVHGGAEIYAVGGVVVPREVVMESEKLTFARIMGEENLEVRRAMIEVVGSQRFVEMAPERRLVHQDRFGKLWEFPRPGDTAMRFVEVLNSTPEPDGSYKTYWLRVDPAMQRARQAVASTFGLSEEEYNPEIET